MSRRVTAHEFAVGILRCQREWRALPLYERAAAMQAARVPLSHGFFSFGYCDRTVFADAMHRAGSTESELRELLGLYSAWRAGDWNDEGIMLLHPKERPSG